MSSKKRGRPATWGTIPTTRSYIPLNVASAIDAFPSYFPDEPEKAQQLILELLSGQIGLARLKLYDLRACATPGILSPAPAPDTYEAREIPAVFVEKIQNSFLIRVSGDSMEDANIHSGDVALIEHRDSTNPPKDKDIVVASVDGQTVLKRYRYRYHRHELVSENTTKGYPPIVISEQMSEHLSVHISGVFHRIIPEPFIL